MDSNGGWIQFIKIHSLPSSDSTFLGFAPSSGHVARILLHPASAKYLLCIGAFRLSERWLVPCCEPLEAAEKTAEQLDGLNIAGEKGDVGKGEGNY